MSKRRHSQASSSHEELSDNIFSEDEIDISSALIGKKKARLTDDHNSENEDQILHEIIREATSKRDIRGGTELLKRTKGKAKLTKGEVGGGSFQSMGMSYGACVFYATVILSRSSVNVRSAPMAASLVDTTGLSNTNTDPTFIYPTSA
jgi:hypothetical protein